MVKFPPEGHPEQPSVIRKTDRSARASREGEMPFSGYPAPSYDQPAVPIDLFLNVFTIDQFSVWENGSILNTV